jgi:aminotransferase
MAFVSRRMRPIPFSDIRQVFEQVSELKSRGLSPAPFHIGQPDFDTPAHIKQAAVEALQQGLTAYTSNYGLPALREAIALRLRRENSIPVDPDTQIIVTVGSNEAIFMAMLATLNPGDEVLIPNPSWLHYFYCAELAGAKVVSVPLREENAFQLDPDDLERRVTRRTRMLVINSPHNPTGAVFSRAVIQAIASFVEKHRLLLLSDEIYDKMIYDSQVHLSPAALEAIRDQTITVNGFSKTYAMTGWRVGYVAASPALISAMIRVHQYSTICATSFAQAGALAALTGPQDCVDQMTAEFARRRKIVVESIQAMPGLSLVPPQGAFYAFPNATKLGADSGTVSKLLLEKANVAVVPGRTFGEFGQGFIRISFACSLPEIEAGMNSLAQFCRQTLASLPALEHNFK